jgi:hypothetical protein
MSRRIRRPVFDGHEKVAYDGPNGAKRVGAVVRQALGSTGRMHLAVAYVTQDLEKLLQVSRARLRQLTLVCDPWSGACNPEVLERLLKLKASVYARPDLHAKVYAGSGGVAVGSANLSGSALHKGTDEAVAFFGDPGATRNAVRWIEALAADSTPLVDLVEDGLAWESVKAAWRNRQWRKSAGTSRRPSLLEALTQPFDHDLTSIRIDLIDQDADDIEPEAKAGAQRTRIRLPAGWDYTYVDGPPTGYTPSEYVSACEKDAKDCAILGLYVKADEAKSRIVRFVSIDPTPGRLIGTAKHGRNLIWYYGPTSTVIDLTRDRRILVNRLNAALKTGGIVLAEKLWERSWWSLKPKEIAALLGPPADGSLGSRP